LVKKTAAKKIVKASPEYRKAFGEAQRAVRALELDLRKLKYKLNVMCHNPMLPGPPPPTKK
jgi:hypothetical protein